MKIFFIHIINTDSTKTGEIRRGFPNPAHLSQETLDANPKEPTLESSTLNTENKLSLANAPVNNPVDQDNTSGSIATAPVESAVPAIPLTANAHLSTPSSTSQSTSSNSIPNKAAPISNKKNNLESVSSSSYVSSPVVSDSLTNKDSLPVDTIELSNGSPSSSSSPSSPSSSFPSSPSSSPSSSSSSASSLSSSSSSAPFSASNSVDTTSADSSIEPEVVRPLPINPLAVKGMVREYPSRLAGLNGLKTGFGPSFKGFNVPRDFYPSFNSYASDFENVLPFTADPNAFAALSAPKYPLLFNSPPFQSESSIPSAEVADNSKTSTNRLSGHSSKISPAFVAKTHPNPLSSVPSEDNMADDLPVSVHVMDESKDNPIEDQPLSYAPTGTIRRRVTNNYDRSQVKPIVIPIKINTRNHYGAPTYIHPGASASANAHSSAEGSSTTSSYPNGQVFGQSSTIMAPWLSPGASLSSTPSLNNPLLMQSIQANSIYASLLSTLLPLQVLNSPSIMPGNPYLNPMFTGFRGPLPSEDSFSFPIPSPSSSSPLGSPLAPHLAKISLSPRPWQQFQSGPVVSKFPSELIMGSFSPNGNSKLSSASKEASEKLIEKPGRPSSLSSLHYAQDSASSATSASYRYSPYNSNAGISSGSGSSVYAYNPYGAYGGNSYTNPYSSYNSYGYGPSYSVAGRPTISDPGSGYVTATPNGAFVTIRFPNMAGINSLLSSPGAYNAYNRPSYGVSSTGQTRPYATSPYTYGFPNMYSADQPTDLSDDQSSDQHLKSGSSSRLSKATRGDQVNSGTNESSASNSVVEKPEASKNETESETKNESNVDIQNKPIVHSTPLAD